MNESRSHRPVPVLLSFCALSAAWLMGGPVLQAHAQPSNRPPLAIDDLHPENSIPSAEATRNDPMATGEIVMEVSARAERAEKTSNFSQAARYYRALAKAVPNRATAYAKACRAHERAGETDAALESCRIAMGKEGVTIDDAALFVDLTLKASRVLAPAQIDDIDALLMHLDTQLHDDVTGQLVVADLRCQVGAKLEDVTRLAACSSKLTELAPKDPRAFVYASILALKKQEWTRVEALIASARAAGLPASATDLMEQKLKVQRESSSAIGLSDGGGTVWFFLAACSALAVFLTWFFHRRSLRAAPHG